MQSPLSRRSSETSLGLESPTSRTFLSQYVFRDALPATLTDSTRAQHIMEFTVEMCMMFVGVSSAELLGASKLTSGHPQAPMGYGTVKTLTDTSVRNCVGDIRAFKPTIMVGVPAVWELIRKGILTKVKAGGSLKSSLFNGAYAAKKASGLKGIVASITDAVVFKAVKQATGGRLKFALSGGAPISKETQEFLSIALVMVLQGYGSSLRSEYTEKRS